MEPGGGGGGIQRNTKEEQTAAGLLALTRLFVYYTIRTNAKENRIVKAKAPPHPPLPPAQAGRKHRKTIQHGKIAWKFL